MIIEIKYGEGGTDSKLFVHDLESAYIRYAQSLGFKSEILLTEEGHVVLQISGKDVWKYFGNETGKHIVQRVPPTENKGRRQTSFISVAALPLKKEKEYKPLPEKDLKITTQTGKQKAGGQNVNRVCSAVRAIHCPTGTTVFINGRDQGQNKKKAIEILTARIHEMEQEKEDNSYNSLKKESLGDRGRGGNKRRTYNFIESRVTDHLTGKKTGNIKAIMKGEFNLLD